MPRARSEPEDFVVEEIPLYAPAGEGGHTFVAVEKRLLTTEQVARALARAAGVPPREVGYAGRKDRVAVARQWFSVPGLAPEAAHACAGEGFRVLEAVPHRHKLRTGQLAGNRFEIVVRDVDEAAAARAGERLARVVREGLPNRFGPQRFGRDAANPREARALLAGTAPVRDRRHARFLLSALQAELFNAVLAERPLAPGALEAGDVAVVHASGGLFVVEDPEREAPRAEAFEISATGPIFGPRAPRPAGAPAAREAAARRRLGIPEDDALAPPRGVRLRGARRALRIRPEEAALTAAGPGAQRLCVRLPTGSYASVLLEALYGPVAGVSP